MQPKLIGLAGRKQSGKDTAAEALAKHGGYSPIAFAKPLKLMIRCLATCGGISVRDAQRMTDGDLKEVPATIFGGLTPRHLMQTIGTEWGRGMVSDSLWVDIALAEAAATAGGTVITDVRFPNEAKAIRDAGGVVWRIDRPGRPVGVGEEHSSEILVDTLPVDKVITNDAPSASEFRLKIRAILDTQ